MVFYGNFLCAQILFCGYREPCTCFNSGIVSNHNTLFPAYIAYHYYTASTRAAAYISVHFVSGKGANLNTLAILIKEVIYTFAGSKFSIGVLSLYLLFPTSLMCPFCLLLHMRNKHLYFVLITIKIYCSGHI